MNGIYYIEIKVFKIQVDILLHIYPLVLSFEDLMWMSSCSYFTRSNLICSFRSMMLIAIATAGPCSNPILSLCLFISYHMHNSFTFKFQLIKLLLFHFISFYLLLGIKQQ